MRRPIRGDMFYAGVDKRRPVIVVSNNMFNKTSNYVNVVPISSRIKRLDLPCHAYLGKEITGSDSMVMCEHYYTVPADELSDYIGTLSKFQMKKIDKAIKCQLGLGE